MIKYFYLLHNESEILKGHRHTALDKDLIEALCINVTAFRRIGSFQIGSHLFETFAHAISQEAVCSGCTHA